MNSYQEIYLSQAQESLGASFDFAVNTMGLDLKEYYARFLANQVSLEFARGNPVFVAGHSGIELALIVLGRDDAPQTKIQLTKGKEYWTGWALAYYQWFRSLSFQEIDRIVSIKEIEALYYPFHEMDIRQFVDKMDELVASRNTETNLARLRKNIAWSQSDLAVASSVSKRTIQQYEQRSKDINKARVWTVYQLAKALGCEIGDLLEKAPYEKKER
jgi:DNA-binding XRE family transcriptional regulator